MKRIFLFIALLSSAFCSAQNTPFQKVSTPYDFRWMRGDSVTAIPYGPVPRLRQVGDLSRPGALFFNTTDSTIYTWTGFQWLAVQGTGGGGSGTVSPGLANKIAYYPASGTTIDDLPGLTPGRAMITDGDGLPNYSVVTGTELNHLSGVTSSVQTQLDGKQATLVSGTNIKTINGSTLLGSGDLVVGGGGTSDHTALSNLAWTSSAHTGTANRVAGFNGSGATSYYQVGVDLQAYNAALAAIVGLAPSNDDVLQYKSGNWANRTIAQLKTDLNYTIPAQFNPIAGTNVNITGTYPNMTFNAAGDANWVFLSDYATPNDGLSDTAGIKAAVATGKNVWVTPGEWLWDGYRCTLNSNQIIRGYGPTSKIRFTQDIADVFWIPQGTHHVQIDYINFIGKGRGAAPGGEVFTLSNAIFIQGDSNRVQYCNFKAVKGSGIHAWVASGTMYANEVSYCRFDSCGVGIYALNNAEYSLFIANQAYHCRWGFYERCAGNNTWDAFTSNYNDLGFGLLGSTGCNGDHGSVSNARINHNTAALDVRQVNNEYVFSNVKFYNGTIAIGSLDTAKRVIFDNCILSGNTFTVSKALSCQFTGGAFGTTAVTVVGSDKDQYFNFCNVKNSPYSTIACGSVLGALTKGFEASDSLREKGIVKINDSTNWKVSVINPISGAKAYANWLYAGAGGGGGGMTNPMTTADDIIYSLDGSGTPGRKAKGADGTFLGVSGGVLDYYTPAGSGGITIGTTTITSGTNTRILYNNSGVSGEYSVTGSGTTVPLSTSPTFTTDITTPQINGGTGTTSKITNKSTTGNGTLTAVAFDFLSGNNGNVNALQMLNNGSYGVNTAAVDGFFLEKLPNGNGGFLDRDQFGNNLRFTTPSGFSTFSGISALTNTAATMMKFSYLTTGTVANGLGIGVQFETENGSGTQKITGQLDNIYTDITNASEDADFVVRLIRAGTLTEAARFTGVGGFSINGSAGSNGQVLTSGGAGAAATWSTPSAGIRGSYVPTITNTTNVSSSSNVSVRYNIQGSQVIIIGTIGVTATSAGANTVVSISLPSGGTSNFAAATDAAGICGEANGKSGVVTADATNDLLVITYESGSTLSRAISFSISYDIIP